MENIEYVLLIVGQLFCVYRAIAAKRILSATLYLAGVSALTSAILYLLGAYQVAVIELSVGAGLVTVLLVYTVSVAGDDEQDPASIISKPLAFVLIAAIAVLLGGMSYPLSQANETLGLPGELSNVLWQQRVLDVYIQIALLFSGVMGVLGLLSERVLLRKEKTLPTAEVSKVVVRVEETRR